MKPTLPLLAVSLLFTACHQSDPPAAVAGRYQLVSGVYQDHFFHTSQPVILKCDTLTGETWLYSSAAVSPPGAGANLAVYGWQSVDSFSNNIERAYKVSLPRSAPDPLTTTAQK